MMEVIVDKELMGDEEDAEISNWLVASGDSVEAGQELVELETSKVMLSIQAPAGGIVTVMSEVGEIVVPGAIIARID